MKTLVIILFTSVFGLSLQAQDYKGSAKSQTSQEKLNDEYCSGLFQSTYGDILDVASTPGVQGYLNIIDWLPGRVAGLQVYNTRYGTSIPYIRGGVPAIFIDEMQVSLATVSALNVNDIAIIKIIKTPFFGGFNAGHGAIAIYTMGGEEEED